MPDERKLMQRTFTRFLASTAQVGLIAATGLVAAAPAHADTTVSTGTTANYNTSAAGNVTIASTGTLTGATGKVVTVDSSNTVTVNSGGTIDAGTATTAASNDIGIAINTGVSTTITNAGTIAVLENFTPTTLNNANTFLNGPISGVSGRYGIYGASGGTITGSISNTGSIVVYGENSAGIEIDSALNGTFSTEGTISVVGDNSFGVKLGSVTGNVTVGGTVTVTGYKAQGYVQAGDVTGALVIDGAIANASSYTDSNAVTLQLQPSRLNTATPVVEIDGNVTGGIVINAPSSSTSSDSNRGTITALGNNPALQIGGATNITIGAATTDNGSYDLGIDGSVSAGTGTSGINTNAIVIGGRGGNVTMAQGMEVYGTVTATTYDANATAIQINAGSTVPTLFNTGTIKAANNAAVIGAGDMIGIQDLSNTLTSITNQGYITATGTTTGRAAAIDLSTSTNNVTITQSYTSTNQTNETNDKAASGYNPDSATSYAGITGNIYTGSGNDTLNITTGTVTGNAYLGAGNNTVALADTAKWTGNIDFGTAGTATMTMTDNSRFNGTLSLNGQPGTLTLTGSARFLGTITGGSSFDVAVNSGTFGASPGAATTSTIHNLTVASGAALRVNIDGSTSTSSLLIANSATFASGAKLSLSVNQLLNISNQTYTVLTANTLTGASGLSAASSLNLPVLFSGTITSDANNVYISLARASAASLGLTPAQTSAYNAIINDASQNTLLQGTLLNIYDTPTLRGRFNEMLPNYAGGSFDIVTRAARTAGRHIDDDSSLFSISNAGAWLEPIVFNGTRTYGSTPGFKTTGGGLSTGFEKVTPVGNVGFSLAWLTGDSKAATFQSVKANEFNFGLFWRKSSGPLYLWAGGNLGRESFKSTRSFNGAYIPSTTATATTNFTYNAAGHWAGWSAGLTVGASYRLPLGEHVSIKPKGVIEYDRLKENGYAETGDTPIALTVAGRTGSQTVATTTLTAQWAAGAWSHEGRPFAVELEAGRRTWLSGNLGTTTGTFETGDTFSIAGDHLPSAWVGGLSIMQGGLDYTWKIGTDVERGTDKGVAYGVRASISIAL